MYSHAPQAYRCPFCAYVRGDGDDRVGQEHVVERTDATLTYVSPKWWPNNEGAVLVIPTEHHENLYTLPDELGVSMANVICPVVANRTAQPWPLELPSGGQEICPLVSRPRA